MAWKWHVLEGSEALGFNEDKLFAGQYHVSSCEDNIKSCK